MEGSLKVKGQNTSSISSNERPEMRTFPIGHLKIEGKLCGLSPNLNYQVRSTPLYSKLGIYILSKSIHLKSPNSCFIPS